MHVLHVHIYVRCYDNSIEDRTVQKEVEEGDWCELCILENA